MPAHSSAEVQTGRVVSLAVLTPHAAGLLNEYIIHGYDIDLSAVQQQIELAARGRMLAGLGHYGGFERIDSRHARPLQRRGAQGCRW